MLIKLFANYSTLILILILGVLLRFNNLAIGHPILYLSNDEAIYHLSALNMIASKSVFPLGNYGPLGSYIQIPFILISFPTLLFFGVVNSLEEFKILILTQPGYLLIIPRVLSAVLGSLSIIAAYYLAVELFHDRKTAIFSALLFSLSFTLTHISHLARSWSPAIFLILLSTIFVIKSVKARKGEMKNTIIAFALAAFCFGFHQISGLVLILLITMRFFYRPILTKVNIFSILIWLVLVSVFNYLSLGGDFLKLVDPSNSTFGLVRDSWQLNSISGIFERLTSPKSFLILWEFLISDPVIFILSAVGLVISFKDTRVKALAVFVVFNLFISFFFFIPLIRYFLPAFALLPIFAGFALNKISTKNYFKRMVILIILLASFNSFFWNYLLTKEPTFTSVRNWLDKNVPVDKPIASTNRRYFDYSPTKDAGDPIRKLKPGYYNTLSKQIGSRYYPNVRNVVYLNEFGDSSFKNLEIGEKLYHLEYIIDSYPKADERLYSMLDKNKYELVAHFSPSGNRILEKNYPSLLFDSAFIFNQYGLTSLLEVDRAGPYFDVIKINE